MGGGNVWNHHIARTMHYSNEVPPLGFTLQSFPVNDGWEGNNIKHRVDCLNMYISYRHQKQQ